MLGNKNVNSYNQMRKIFSLIFGLILCFGCRENFQSENEVNFSELSLVDLGVNLPGRYFEDSKKWQGFFAVKINEKELINLLLSSKVYRENIMTSYSDLELKKAIDEIISNSDKLRFVQDVREVKKQSFLLVMEGFKKELDDKEWILSVTIDFNE